MRKTSKTPGQKSTDSTNSNFMGTYHSSESQDFFEEQELKPYHDGPDRDYTEGFTFWEKVEFWTSLPEDRVPILIEKKGVEIAELYWKDYVGDTKGFWEVVGALPQAGFLKPLKPLKHYKPEGDQ